MRNLLIPYLTKPKDILQNWMAGLLILWRQPFRRGDQIVVGSFEGTVEHIEARATLIKTYDDRLVVIPNNDIYLTAVIVNTAFPTRRSQVDVTVGYADEIGAARAAILSALTGVEGVLAMPAPDVLAWEIAESGVTLRIRWWTKSLRAEVVRVQGQVVERVKHTWTAANIDMPYPTTTVLFQDQTQPADKDRSAHREGWPSDSKQAVDRRR